MSHMWIVIASRRRSNPYVDGPLLARVDGHVLDRLACIHMSGLLDAVAHDRWPRWFPRRELHPEPRRHGATGFDGLSPVPDRSIPPSARSLSRSGIGAMREGAPASPRFRLRPLLAVRPSPPRR